MILGGRGRSGGAVEGAAEGSVIKGVDVEPLVEQGVHKVNSESRGVVELVSPPIHDLEQVVERDFGGLIKSARCVSKVVSKGVESVDVRVELRRDLFLVAEGVYEAVDGALETVDLSLEVVHLVD